MCLFYITFRVPKWVKALNWSRESECAPYINMSVAERVRITEALCKDALTIQKARFVRSSFPFLSSLFAYIVVQSKVVNNCYT